MTLSKILRNRCASFVAIAMLLALASAVYAPRAAAQDHAWTIVRADYGFRDQRSDVTRLIQDLLSKGGVNGRVAVNNQTMGGDPAPGKEKTLRVYTRTRDNQQREFDYVEDSFLPVNLFAVRFEENHDRDDQGRDDRDRHDDRDRRNSDLDIVTAYYGVQGKNINVTDRVQSLVRDNSLSLVVNNGAMGMDPAPGFDKLLIIIYRYRGREDATAAVEGHTIHIP
jgi:hypothetical protein